MWWNIAEAAGPSTVFLSQTNNNLLILADLSSPLLSRLLSTLKIKRRHATLASQLLPGKILLNQQEIILIY